MWKHNEVAYYQRWEVETHRDHRDFGKRDSNEGPGGTIATTISTGQSSSSGIYL
jgi:hypothetical protein